MNELKNIHHVNFCHVDGPLVVYKDGSLYWLSLYQRFMVVLGFKNRVLKKIDSEKLL